MSFSFWEKEQYFKGIDVVVIGSGIVGLNAALQLKIARPKWKIVVLERGMLPFGASSKNAGFVCYGSPSEILDDLKQQSESEVFSLVEKRFLGAQRLLSNLGPKALDFHQWGGYEVFDNVGSFQACESEIEYLNKQFLRFTKTKNTFHVADDKIKQMGLKKVKHMIVSKLEGQIDTGKMIQVLTEKVRSLGVLVLTGAEVELLAETGNSIELKLKNGEHLAAKKAVVATNGFARELFPHISVQPARAQVVVTSPIKNLQIKGVFHYDCGYYYFRNIGDRILFGGGRNLDFKTEETTQFGLTQTVQDKLEEMLRTMILPGKSFRIEHRWSGIMGVGPQKSAIVKALSANCYVAVRMGGMGVALGSLVGEEVAHLLPVMA